MVLIIHNLQQYQTKMMHKYLEYSNFITYQKIFYIYIRTHLLYRLDQQVTRTPIYDLARLIDIQPTEHYLMATTDTGP